MEKKFVNSNVFSSTSLSSLFFIIFYHLNYKLKLTICCRKESRETDRSWLCVCVLYGLERASTEISWKTSSSAIGVEWCGDGIEMERELHPILVETLSELLSRKPQLKLSNSNIWIFTGVPSHYTWPGSTHHPFDSQLRKHFLWDFFFERGKYLFNYYKLQGDFLFFDEIFPFFWYVCRIFRVMQRDQDQFVSSPFIHMQERKRRLRESFEIRH